MNDDFDRDEDRMTNNDWIRENMDTEEVEASKPKLSDSQINDLIWENRGCGIQRF